MTCMWHTANDSNWGVRRSGSRVGGDMAAILLSLSVAPAGAPIVLLPVLTIPVGHGAALSILSMTALLLATAARLLLRPPVTRNIRALSGMGHAHAHGTHHRPLRADDQGGAPMAAWTSDDLSKIGAADELELAVLRRDGTLRKPVTVWVVRHGDDLYVRSWRGRTGTWFRAAQVRHEGHIRAGGVEKDVTFVEETDPGINDQIDAAYRTKYHRYSSYVPPMISSEARATTLRLVPRSTGS
jgi:hypothetical protein